MARIAFGGLDGGNDSGWDPSYDERQSGGFTGGSYSSFPSESAPITTPGKPIATYPAPSSTANDWRPPTTPAGQQWDPNVASFVPTNIPIDPTGYVMQGGQLVGRSNPSARTSAGGGGDWIAQTLADVQSTDDPEFWRRVIGADPKVAAGDQSAIDYWKDRIRRGDGSALVKSGQLQKFQDGPPTAYGGFGNGTNPGGFDDPSSVLYLNEVLSRLAQLKQPRSDPAEGQLAQLIQSLVDASKQQPYTAGNDAALVAHYRDPLTQARDAAVRQNTEQASRRGFLPSSGLLRRLNTDTNSAYIQGIAKGSNDLGVRAVDEQQTRALQAIQALGGLVQNNRTTQDRQDAVANQVLNLASIFPQFDERRLALLLNASADNPGAAISGLTGVGNLGLNASALNNSNSAASAQAWADFLYRLSQAAGK
jgi:hypothetical protein